MPSNQFVDFKAVKAAVTMEQVLQHYSLLGQFKRRGDSLSGPCPLHNGTNPTQFRVSISKNVWNCFSQCKGGGNVLDFVARKEEITVHAAALKLCEWFNIPFNSSSDEQTPRAASRRQRSPCNEPSRNSEGSPRTEPASEENTPNKPLGFRLEKLAHSHPYLTERGLTQETIVDFGLGYCSKGMMTGRIAIPIHNSEGKVVAYAGRWPGDPRDDTPKYKLPPGFRKSLELFNFDRAVQEPAEIPLVMVEGFFDAIKLHQHGCRKVVALMGSTMSAAQEETIRKHMGPQSRIIVMLDEDDAGRAGRENILIHLARWAFVRVHVFTEEGKQPEHLTAEEVAAITS